MNRQLALACKALGLEGVSWHTLRPSNAMLLDTLRTARSRAGTSRALLFRDHPRGLSALAASRSEGAVEKMEALLKDPKLCKSRKREARQYNETSGIYWSGREDLNLRPPGPEHRAN